MQTVLKRHSVSAPYSHSASGHASIPTNLIFLRYGANALISAGGSLSDLPSHTNVPSASTMQIEIVLSDTSSPTNSAIPLPSVAGSTDPSWSAAWKIDPVAG
jgi:hypothetical protein